MSRLCVTSFIKLGATAVIGQLWSVEDDVARPQCLQSFEARRGSHRV
jgi:CHAT domain-containing protein